MWALSMPIPFQPPLHAGAGGYFAPHIRSYMRRAKAPDHIGILVALKDRTNALKNPYAHLHQHEVSFDSIKDSIMLWDPIRYEETCPSSDGAFAIVLGSEKVGDEAAAQGRPPAWLHGTAMRSEPTMSADRDTVLPLGGALCAKDVYRQAGITDPRRQVDCVEMYVPFSLVRADVAGEPALRRAGRGMEDGRGRRHAARLGRPAREHVRRRALDEPDRRVAG